MSYLAENSVLIACLAIAIFLGVTTFKCAWREGWHWAFGLMFAAIRATMTFFCFPFGALGAAAIGGKVYKSYG